MICSTPISQICSFKVLYSPYQGIILCSEGAIDISVPPKEESIVVIRSLIFIIFYSYGKYLPRGTISRLWGLCSCAFLIVIREKLYI